jgi:hypothetical protein
MKYYYIKQNSFYAKEIDLYSLDNNQFHADNRSNYTKERIFILKCNFQIKFLNF